MNQPTRETPLPQEPEAQTVSTLQVIQSVAWSFFGVQSQRNRERDFKHGDPWQFIFIGLAMTAGVVLMFWGAVQLALHLAGAAD